MAAGALTFGAATTDKVDIGVVAALDNLDPFTVLVWSRPTTFTSNRVLWSKGSNTKVLRLSGTAGDVQGAVIRASSSGYTTNNAPLALNTKCFLAFTFSSAAAAGEIINIFSGRVGVNATECTYGTVTDGSGAVTSEAGVTSAWGNNASVSSSAWQGDIYYGAVFAGILSLADIISWQNNPRQVVGSNVALEFKAFGLYGADAIDFSGKANGTVTGATQTALGGLGITTPIDDVQALVTAAGGNTQAWHVSNSRLNASVSAWKDALGANNGRAAGLTYAQATGAAQPTFANDRLVFDGTKTMALAAQDSRLAYDGSAPLYAYAIVKATSGPILSIAQDPTSTAVTPYAGLQVNAGGKFGGIVKPAAAGTAEFQPDSGTAANDGVIRIIGIGKGTRSSGTSEDEAWRFQLRGQLQCQHEQCSVATTVAGGLKSAIGQLGAAKGVFEICAIVLLAADPSPTFLAALETYALTFGALAETSKTGRAIVIGDSNCVGTATTDRLTALIGSGTKSWPYIFSNDITNSRGKTLVQENFDANDLHKINVSHGGNNIDDLLAALPRTMGPNADGRNTSSSYVIVWAIGGSVLLSHQTLAQLKTKFATLKTTINGYGYKLYLATVTDGGTLGASTFGLYNATSPSTVKSTEGQAAFDFDAELRSNPTPYCDGVIDMDGLTQVAPFNRACDNVTYFNADKVHHLDAATALDGPYIRQQFNAIVWPSGVAPGGSTGGGASDLIRRMTRQREARRSHPRHR
jgi:hypothetical protein